LRYIYVKIFIAPRRPGKISYPGFFVCEKRTNDKFRFLEKCSAEKVKQQSWQCQPTQMC
jgi:hypothetical protein